MYIYNRHKQALWKYTNRSGALEIWTESWSIFNRYEVVLTPLQSTYLNTVYQWFESENISIGETAFLQAMLNLTNKFPENNDARVLLGLAYLNIAQSQNSELNVLESPALFTARQILQIAFTNEPEHPGCLHYLIHAYDVPRIEISLQGVPYAYKYGQVAVTASHAQHMPTHIWTHIGSWSLAQLADVRAIEVSLSLCLRKQQSNYTQFDRDHIFSFSLSHLMTYLNRTQIDYLLTCDCDNRAHSQQWLVYTYLQTGQFRKSLNILNDLIESNNIYTIDKYYLPFVYRARAYMITNIFFWAMYEKEKNHDVFLEAINQIFVGINSSSIEELGEDFDFAWPEVVIRFGKLNIYSMN